MNSAKQDELERYRKQIRYHIDRRAIETFDMFGVPIVLMGRLELLGVICFLLKQHALSVSFLRPTESEK